MLTLEDAMERLNELASTVTEDIDLKTRWVAEADIGIMSKVFSAQKSFGPKKAITIPMVIELRKQCAEVIATKILELQKLIESEIPHDTIVSILRNWSALSFRVC